MLARLATFDEAAGTYQRFPALRAACERALARWPRAPPYSTSI
jgi:hypothetical protein